MRGRPPLSHRILDRGTVARPAGARVERHNSTLRFDDDHAPPLAEQQEIGFALNGALAGAWAQPCDLAEYGVAVVERIAERVEESMLGVARGVVWQVIREGAGHRQRSRGTPC